MSCMLLYSGLSPVLMERVTTLILLNPIDHPQTQICLHKG